MADVRGSTLWLSLALIGVGACDGAGTSDPLRTGQTETPPAGTTGDVKPVAHGETIDKVVSWPHASTLDLSARASLSTSARAAVDSAPVPVLAVAQSSLLSNAIVTRGEAFAAVSSRADGVIVSLHATSRAQRYAHIKPVEGPSRVRGHAAFVTANETIWSAAWIEGGVAYSLELECGSLPDPRCDDDGHLLQLAEALVFVGGREVKP